jgi:carbon storage regulator
MLIITRRVGEEIVISDQIRVRVAHVGGKRIQLAVAAPESVRIHRGEVYSQRGEFQRNETADLPIMAIPLAQEATHAYTHYPAS